MSNTALVAIEKINPLQLFTQDGVEPLLEKITAEVKSFKTNITTAKGRKDVATLANKVARSKTLLDGMGKDLTAEWKAKSKVVDESRKKIRDELDELKVVARKPLTDWEASEKKRVEKHREDIDLMKSMAKDLDGLASEELKPFVSALEVIPHDCDYEEFQDEAERVRTNSFEAVEQAYVRALDREKQQKELEVLRQEKEEREAKEQQEREARELKEREERERKEAEEKARLEKEHFEREEKARIEVAKKAEIEAREKAEREAAAEKQRRIDAESLRKQEAEQAKADKIAAEKQAKLDAEAAAKQAIEDEQKRVAAEKQKELEAEQKREANLKHRKKINNAALAALSAIFNKDEFDSFGSDELAKAIVGAIAKGEIPHVKIQY